MTSCVHMFPIAVSLLVLLWAGSVRARTAEERVIVSWLGDDDRAFNGKDLQRLAAFYHPDVTIYEGGGINNGWADYRDHHLGWKIRHSHPSARRRPAPGGR